MNEERGRGRESVCVLESVECKKINKYLTLILISLSSLPPFILPHLCKIFHLYDYSPHEELFPISLFIFS